MAQDLRDERMELLQEIEQLRAERTRLSDELMHAQRMEAAGTLAAGVAHDMNNVLAAIMNLCEVVLDQPHDPETRADLEQIVMQAERGAGLTKALLAFSRKGQYRKQVLELDVLMRQTLPLFAHTLPKAIEIHPVLGADRARVDGDPVQLAQVVINLALNASDAMGGQGRLEIATGSIEVTCGDAAALELAPGRYVQLLVTDSGCGMDDATRCRIFEPFFTTKPLGKGTGLGLALVWGVVKHHGGSVTVRSQPGAGTTFAIHLPMTDAALPILPETARRSVSSGPATILVVDDEPAVRAGITRVLERTGFRVLGASDGAEALRVFAGHADAIRLVVLDMEMPVMRGSECLRRLRATSSVPVLIATGYARDEDVQALVAHGAALLEKPFASASLVVEVTRLLEQSPRRRLAL